jgi:hypothetical protein
VDGGRLLKASWMASRGVFASVSLFPLLSKTLNYFVMEKTKVCNNQTLRGSNLDINVVVSLDSPSSEF